MYSYDLQMSEIHALLGWSALALFLLRGLAFQFGAAWASDSRLSVLAFGVYVLLAVTGLSLWVLRFLNPTRDSWLLAKLLALGLFALCSHLALGSRNEFRLAGFLLGLLLLAYMLGVSITRSAGLGIF